MGERKNDLLACGGCAEARDVRISRFLEDCWRAELCNMAAFTHRAAILETHSVELADLMDRIALDEAEHFRIMGSLIVSLGGNPPLRARWESRDVIPPRDARAASAAIRELLCRAVREKREMIDRYQTAMGRIADRVVRSFLCQILSDEQRHVARLEEMK